MQKRTKLMPFCCAVLITLFAAAPIAAAPIDDILDAIQDGRDSGLIEFKYNNWEMATIYGASRLHPGGPVGGADIAVVDALPQVPATGAIGSEDGWGVFKVTGAFNQGGTELYDDGDFGTEMTGMFYGITDFHVDLSAVAGSQVVNSVGMVIDLYVDESPDFDITLGSLSRTGFADYTTATDGTLALRLISIPGHLNPPGTNGGQFAEFVSTFNPTAFTGEGEAWVSVVGGAWADEFDSDFFTAPNAGFPAADGQMVFETFPLIPGIADWLVRSNDPLRLIVAEPESVVPEPSTVSLLLVGLAGLSATRRRRRR